ncbi:MAG: ADP-glyceromanno-heptose 6-epimerase [Kiritimatiellae bacterium]|nr:ADP-glyceromanno-heptose 6-epimerase [Kiritimatiellia bacterium]MDW8459148.1 ADP-glyceromanno-heptose 6-epimerase [Verrucomicrobiota bacterium]
MSASVIVTGGAGFIGSNIVAALNARGEDKILVVDLLGRDEKWKNLVGLFFEDYLEAPEFRRALLAGALPPVRTVFHMGACSSTTEKDASYLIDNNYRFTRELCDWCLKTGARFIYASSGATYGDGSLGYSDDDAVTPTLRPLNMYGYSKHLFDLWALRSGALRRIVGLKFFNVYGPREEHKGDMRSVVSKAYSQIMHDGVVRLFRSYHPAYRDGEQVRDFIYVRDAVAVSLWFAENPGVNGLFNVGTGVARTWLDLARAVFAAMDREPAIEFIDMPESLRGKYQYRTEADISKLRRAGYSAPITSLEEGVRDYVRNWLMKR